MLRDSGITDVTIEIFNHCAGSCTGCLLTISERRADAPVMGPAAFSTAMAALVRHQSVASTRYRPVLSFGDIPSLDLKLQHGLYTAVAQAGMALGATMTFASDGMDERYDQSLDLLLDIHPDAVFDITIDPYRLKTRVAYGARIRTAIARAPELHLALLLSEALIDRETPEELALWLSHELAGRPVSLGFTPALERLSRPGFSYDVVSAAEYARRFYAATSEGRSFLEAELERFEAVGRYRDFLSQTFHIGPDLKLYPVAYTIFGDVILDARNGGAPLGSLRDASIETLVSGKLARRMDAMAQAWLDDGPFGCSDCRFSDACLFNGVGAARQLYRDVEIRSGACHGPVALLDGVPA